MKRLIIFLIIISSLVSCEEEIQLQPSIPKLKKVLTYSSIHKNELHCITTFEYDINGNLTKEAYYSEDTINPLIYSIFEYENAQKAHEYLYNAVNNSYILLQKCSFQYDGNLLVKEELSYPPDEEILNFSEYKYDQNSNLIFVSRVQVDPFFSWKTVYIFDSNNLKTKTIYFNENSDTSGYIEHYYVDKLLSNEKVYNSQNELCCEYNYIYDSENNLIEKTKTVKGETRVIESMSYLNSLLVEKTIYDWTFDKGYIYSFRCVHVFEYE